MVVVDGTPVAASALADSRPSPEEAPVITHVLAAQSMPSTTSKAVG
jgi:hypothetical protein